MATQLFQYRLQSYYFLEDILEPLVHFKIAMLSDIRACNNPDMFHEHCSDSPEVSNELSILKRLQSGWQWTSPRSVSGDIPIARAFHSSNMWKQQMVVFGGRTYCPSWLASLDDIDSNFCYLNDVCLFDTVRSCWRQAKIRTGLVLYLFE